MTSMSHRHRRPTRIGLIGLVGSMVVAAGCSSTADPAASAVELIEGELSEQIQLGPLTGDCEEPADDPAVDEEFACTGVTEDGAIINFTAVFESDDAVFIYPTNLVVESSVFEVEASATLGPEFGVEIDPAQIDCPEGVTVLDAAGQMFCTITDVETGGVLSMTVTLGNYLRDQGFEERFYEVGDQIE
jgi:hypothetical protein